MKLTAFMAFSMAATYLIGAHTTVAQNELDLQQKCLQIIDNRESKTDAERLHHLFNLTYEYKMIENPEWATSRGFPGQDHRWSDRSLEAIARRRKELQYPLQAIESINRKELNKEDRLSYDLFKRNYQNSIDGGKFRGELMPINQMGGIHQSAARVLSQMPIDTRENSENIIARLNGLPLIIDQTIILLEEGLKEGITPPRITLRDVPQQVLNQIVDNPSEAPVLGAFEDLPAGLDEDVKADLIAQAHQTYRDIVSPAYRKLHDYLADKYIPNCRQGIARADLPDGRKWYAYLVRNYTTTDLSPDEIFEIGQSEVSRIRGEMEEVIKETEFDGDFKQFIDYLRSDPKFYYDKAEDLVREYRNICKRADAELIQLFGRLPSLPYGVIRVPSYAEKSQTTAYYQPGSYEAARPGYYYVNTYDLKSRPKWEMEALSLHEAVPGHHLQIAIAQELEGLPEFRKQGWFTAYGEGWALYAESLGEQMGFYADPYAKFGQLTYEMWRAIRLVVDVGIHSKGWTRQQAIDFFMENSSKSEHDVTVEIDRYIVWPGQALAYKIGQLKISSLRNLASETLGEKFDLRQFHDEILGHGSVPLDLLESHIKEWIEAVKAGT